MSRDSVSVEAITLEEESRSGWKPKVTKKTDQKKKRRKKKKGGGGASKKTSREASKSPPRNQNMILVNRSKKTKIPEQWRREKQQ